MEENKCIKKCIVVYLKLLQRTFHSGIHKRMPLKV